MPPTTKEAQRAELHKTIWRIANDLRGSVDGWDFKSYVLGMLFYRFISENLTVYINRGEHEAGESDFDYARLPDAEAEFGRKETVAEKGFYVLPSELFENVRERAAKGRRMGRSIHDGRFSGLGGIRSGRRLDQRGPASSWYGGAGDMGVRGGGDDADVPGGRGHPHEKDRGPGAPQPPTFPGPPAPVVTESGGAPKDGREEATKALDDTAAATRETADALGAIAPSAKEAADGARKTADAATELDAPVQELVTGLTDAAEGLGQVKASVGEAVAGVGQVVKAVNDLKGEMDRLKAALDQLQKAA